MRTATSSTAITTTTATTILAIKRTELNHKTVLVASPIYLLVAATAGIACRTDFGDGMEPPPTPKALAPTQAIRIVWLFATKASLTVLSK